MASEPVIKLFAGQGIELVRHGGVGGVDSGIGEGGHKGPAQGGLQRLPRLRGLPGTLQPQPQLQGQPRRHPPLLLRHKRPGRMPHEAVHGAESGA